MSIKDAFDLVSRRLKRKKLCVEHDYALKLYWNGANQTLYGGFDKKRR